MFSDAERIAMLDDEVEAIAAATGTRISVVTFSDQVTAARAQRQRHFPRLRDGTD
jgi:hypothetical protein